MIDIKVKIVINHFGVAVETHTNEHTHTHTYAYAYTHTPINLYRGGGGGVLPSMKIVDFSDQKKKKTRLFSIVSKPIKL